MEVQVQVASATQRRNFWACKASGMFPFMAKAAVPLSPQLRLSGTGLPGAVSTKARNQLGIDVATKLVAIKANLGSS